jgi:hypothetical protein
MSTWISKAIVISLLLSGCVLPDGMAAVSQSKSSDQNALPQFIQLESLVLVGPSGFCPLPGTQRKLSGADFVAFAPCGGDKGAILAATIGDEGSAAGVTLTSAVLAPYFETRDGKAALRGAGSKDEINVHEVVDYRGAVVLRLTREDAGKARDSWRALMEIQGRLITLSVRPLDGMAIPGRDGHSLVTRFIKAMKTANAGGA